MNQQTPSATEIVGRASSKLNMLPPPLRNAYNNHPRCNIILRKFAFEDKPYDATMEELCLMLLEENAILRSQAKAGTALGNANAYNLGLI